jgi:membrane protein implicated in regulation of membrane protease activity
MAITIAFTYLGVDMYLPSHVYTNEIRAAPPLIMGMSVFMGYYAFDLQGIFYGPLLICLVTIVQDMMKNLSRKQKQ